jgi:hypothetical protein
MKNEIMASFLLAGAVLLLGVGGYMTLSGAGANDTVQENITANASVPHVVANATNVLANASIPKNISGNGSAIANQSANASNIINTTSNLTNGTVSNHTNITIVYNDTGTYGGSSGGNSGSSSSGRNSHPANNTITANTINGSGGLLHYNDCLTVSNGKVCLSDLAAESPNDAILTVYDAKGKLSSNIEVAPNGNGIASLGNGKFIYVSVYSTAINGSDIQALVYIRDSGIYSRQSVLVSQGMLQIGDCVNLANSSACLEDVAVDWPHQAIFSLYGANGKFISNVMVQVQDPTSIVIGGGKDILITVSQTIITNGSAWANTTVKYTSSDFGGRLLFYDECVNTSHASVCLSDMDTKTHDAILTVYGANGKFSSNIQIAQGASEQVNVDDSNAVMIYVYGTMASGSSVWALVSATDTKIGNNAVSGTIGFDECVSNDVAKVCLYDFDSSSPNNPIFEVYNAGGDLVSNVMVAPGASKTVRITNSTSAEISVLSKDLNAYTATVSIARG